MPYKFDTDKVKLPEGFDRRIKLSKEQREEIFASTLSQRKLALLYKVSRKLIRYVKFPETYAADLEARRGRWKDFYDKKSHRRYMQNHRRYKQTIMQSL